VRQPTTGDFGLLASFLPSFLPSLTWFELVSTISLLRSGHHRRIRLLLLALLLRHGHRYGALLRVQRRQLVLRPRRKLGSEAALRIGGEASNEADDHHR
jgi:hypothetical protein